ncbi:ribonuclease R [Bdellovibrio sp. HCB337]|uniref:ribonuclease R n=1 Tax=Bdellovibrio sp. HCB337 TaxID=3394358 RepID=UPI0039A422C7
MFKKKFLQGTIKRHPDGFGFFIPDNPEHPDVYIPRQSMQGVMTSDKVMVDVTPERGGDRFRGEIVRVVSRGFRQVVGVFHIINDRQALIKDEGKGWGEDLKIDLTNSMGAKEGQLVAAQILQYPEDGKPFSGRVTEIIGDAMDPMNDIKRVIAANNIPQEFTDSTLAEAKKFPEQPQESDFKGRRDLRKLDLITIDGATAKDFDDAVYVEMNNKGFLLYVAIADVSHYVRIGSAIDKDAYERGTSVYFPNFVVPMLPEALSNGLCSLNPHVPRLCMVSEIQFDFTGATISSDFYEAVMESKARVTYGQAQEVIDGAGDSKFDHVKDNILRCADLAKILMAKRFKEGSLDLEIPETELEIDGSGVPIDIIKSERLFAHRLIEEMMLAANVAVATFLDSRNVPALYRIHEPPNEQAIRVLEKYLWNFGGRTKLGSDKLQKRLTKALEEFEGKPQAQILNILTLRSMSQAKYNMNNVGHFGLGFEFYAHFTSPIRRYPDLIIHRLLKNQVMHNSPYRLMSEEDLLTAGTILSAAEQRSTKAERQVQSIKKARFMQKFIGQELEGMISSVAKFGIFVLLREYDCDGLVRTDDLGADHFEFDEENLRLRGKRSGKVFNIGDSVKIQVAAADPELGQVNFILAENAETAEEDAETKFPVRRERERGNDRGQDRGHDRNRDRDRRPGKNKPSDRPSIKPLFGKKDSPRREKTSQPSRRFEPRAKEETPRTEKPESKGKFMFKGKNLVVPSSARSRKLQFADRSKLSFNVEVDDEERDVESRQEFKGGPSKNRQSDRKDSQKRSKASNNSRGLRKARVSRGSGKNKAR